MPRYIRSKLPDHTYFFTVRAARRGDDLFVRHVDVLRGVMRKAHLAQPFQIDEIVVLPDVIYCLWTLPPGDADFSRRWRMIKSLFSRAVPAPEDVSDQRLRPGEKGLWQRRFWEHRIRDGEDLALHRHMIFTAPVQAGLVNRPEHWPYSSIHRALAQGTVAPFETVGAGYAPIGRTTRAPYSKPPLAS
ncbi:transposase [uncultured Tateyamaria sp.]|uniref:REP-associated tyrosine transposase n=1 Tax=uncultured Tateyamaria sp. TaxID=455651 RepID=UPI002634EE24|nr:transposase [uncultured Tateyamaria sp.]